MRTQTNRTGRALLLVSVACLILVPLATVGGQEAVRDNRFGAVEALWDPQAAAEAGVAWERILFYWSHLQPNGPEDWNTLHVPDEWLQAAQANGREVVGLLKNTPWWAAAGDPISEASPPRGLELPVSDPGNLWAAFVGRAVAHYAPRGVHRWIIWNEPDIRPGVYGEEWSGSIEEYYRLLKVAYQVIKQADPTAQVHLAGLTYWHDPGWLRRFLAVAAADSEGAANGFFFDVVSLHIYFQTDTVDRIVYEARGALSAYGLGRPIWINETNASPDSDPLWPVSRPRWRVDLREQASFILQAHALGLAAGAQRIAVYKLIDAGLPPGGEPFGLLRPDHSRRPAFEAYQLVTRFYAGTRSARVARDPLWAQVTLNRNERTTRVFWARTAQPVTLRVPALASTALLIDQEANERVLPADGGHYELTLPGARCVDAQAGCFIGGPTYLLVEEAPAGDPGTPVPVGTVVPTPEAPLTGTVAGPTATATPRGATAEPPPTLTQTRAPSPTTRVASPTLAILTDPAPSLTAVPTAAERAAITPSPSSSATPRAEAYPPAVTDGQARSGERSWMGILALAAAGVLTGYALWRARAT
jgi:hypothetical protein